MAPISAFTAPVFAPVFAPELAFMAQGKYPCPKMSLQSSNQRIYCSRVTLHGSRFAFKVLSESWLQDDKPCDLVSCPAFLVTNKFSFLSSSYNIGTVLRSAQASFKLRFLFGLWPPQKWSNRKILQHS